MRNKVKRKRKNSDNFTWSHLVSVFVLSSLLVSFVFPSYSKDKALPKDLKANQEASTVHLVSYQSVEGIQRFQRTSINKDFFALSNAFVAQPDGLTCGPTTASIVLNALHSGSKKGEVPLSVVSQEDKKYLPKQARPEFFKYTPKNFFTPSVSHIKSREEVYGKPINGKSDFGFQLRQLHKALLALDVLSELHVITKESQYQEMKRKWIQNLSLTNDYIIVNYYRKSLGQKGGGHFSPVGAYDKKSDSFLILDVNPETAPWVWVKSRDIFNAMKTFDTVENRGYLLVKNKN